MPPPQKKRKEENKTKNNINNNKENSQLMSPVIFKKEEEKKKKNIHSLFLFSKGNTMQEFYFYFLQNERQTSCSSCVEDNVFFYS